MVDGQIAIRGITTPRVLERFPGSSPASFCSRKASKSMPTRMAPCQLVWDRLYPNPILLLI